MSLNVGLKGRERKGSRVVGRDFCLRLSVPDGALNLNKDQDDTLDRKELGSLLTAQEFVAADPDKDSTLTKEEYVALATKLFKQADVDGDGKLEAKELNSKAGRALLRLIR